MKVTWQRICFNSFLTGATNRIVLATFPHAKHLNRVHRINAIGTAGFCLNYFQLFGKIICICFIQKYFPSWFPQTTLVKSLINIFIYLKHVSFSWCQPMVAINAIARLRGNKYTNPIDKIKAHKLQVKTHASRIKTKTNLLKPSALNQMLSGIKMSYMPSW